VRSSAYHHPVEKRRKRGSSLMRRLLSGWS
jgi:hypothetical protein